MYMSLSVLLLLVLPQTLRAFSAGADPDGGGYQSCDAIDVCKFGCPQGMHLVAPPERSVAYSLRTGTGTLGSDPTHYNPGELLELYVTVEQRVIRLIPCFWVGRVAGAQAAVNEEVT